MTLVGTKNSTSNPADTNIGSIKVESIPSLEANDIAEITRLTVLLQEKRKNSFPPQKNEILRGVHPKSHGCVDAIFTIDDNIDSEYKVGLFKNSETYKAKIRFSNASVLKLHDLSEDKDGNRPNQSRGMAIKVYGVKGNVLLPDENEQNQDFLMVNTPEFAFTNVRDYLRLTKVLDVDPMGANPDPYFIPLVLIKAKLLDPITLELKPLPAVGFEKIKDAWNFFKNSGVFADFTHQDLKGTELSINAVINIKKKTVRNPLQVPYFSASPFRFGPDHVMKFSVVPAIETEQTVFTDEEKNKLDSDYLAQALKETMTQNKKTIRKEPLKFNFMVQVIENRQLDQLGLDKTIENASIAWDEKLHKVASISIPAVDEQEAPDFVDACKSLEFTPWHALEEHAPLGGINRLRKPVYSKSAKFRANPDMEIEKM